MRGLHPHPDHSTTGVPQNGRSRRFGVETLSGSSRLEDEESEEGERLFENLRRETEH